MGNKQILKGGGEEMSLEERVRYIVQLAVAQSRLISQQHETIRAKNENITELNARINLLEDQLRRLSNNRDNSHSGSPHSEK